ncbi:hypothetical protein F5B18DRAFT_670668 [Nemania serpens]|nr:hypothetical protein F5B18DRAFT_670668 [Nemania serpens]
MSAQQNAAAACCSRTISKRVLFNPKKDNPTEAEKYVRTIFKHQQNSFDSAAAHLAPLYGFGRASTFDVLARSRAQAIFVCPEIKEPLQEFVNTFTQDKWGLPVASWIFTLALVHENRRDEAWTAPASPISGKGGPDQYYARFLIRVLTELGATTRKSRHMLNWLRDAQSEDDVLWVLFHALMYLQLVVMDKNKAAAPFKDVVQYYVARFADFTVKFVSARKGIDEVESRSIRKRGTF